MGKDSGNPDVQESSYPHAFTCCVAGLCCVCFISLPIFNEQYFLQSSM